MQLWTVNTGKLQIFPNNEYNLTLTNQDLIGNC